VLVRLLSGPSQGSTSLTGLGPIELAAITVAALLCAATVRQIAGIQAVSAQHRRRTPESRIVPRPFPLSVSQVTTEPVLRVAAEPTPHLTSQTVPQTAPK
jgi:hypothetical protein